VIGVWRNYYAEGAFHIPVAFGEDDPYEGTDSMSASASVFVFNALKDLERKLGGVVRFIQRTTESYYIRIGEYGSGCYSYVGRIPLDFQPQVINLGPGCARAHIVEHEMAHALGFFHEHTRGDRDAYVRVHWENIPPETAGNFEILENSRLRGTTYDYFSVLHYPRRAFAINETRDTLEPLQENITETGNTQGVTPGDILKIRMLYRCVDGVRDYAHNCGPQCPCQEGEGACTQDAGCAQPLVCVRGVCARAQNQTRAPTRAPTAAPTRTPTQAPPTRAQQHKAVEYIEETTNIVSMVIDNIDILVYPLAIFGLIFVGAFIML
jgi:hypothetical protein